MQKNSSLLASGPNPDTVTYTLRGRIDAATLSGFRLELIPHKSLPGNCPGRADNGNVVVTGWKVEVAAEDSFAKPTELKLASASASFHQPKFPPANALDNAPKTLSLIHISEPTRPY